MTDTSAHIKELQLKSWLAKEPAERLLQFITDNDLAFKAFKKMKETKKEQGKNPVNNKG